MKQDIIVIGAGAAGVSAAIYAKSRGMDVVVIEQNKIGGIIGNVSTVTHYSGIVQNETGSSFADRLQQQLADAKVPLIKETVTNVELADSEKKVYTDKNVYKAEAVIIANGSSPRKLGIPGEEELAGNGIGLNAAKDGQRYTGKHVYVVGGADGAVKEALYLSQFAKKLTIVHFEEQLGCIDEFKEKVAKANNIEVKLETRLTGVYGEHQVDELELTNVRTGASERVKDEGCGIFVYAGLVPNTQLYEGIFETEDGFLKVNEKMETEITGVYVAGDIRVKQVRQVATAVADGAIAAINASAYVAGL